jgi:tetratricopeptide (TPR) repeat protein
LASNNRLEEADKEFEAAIRLNPGLFEAYYFYARTSFAQGNLKKAAQLFEKASLARPEDYQSLLLVAQIYLSLGRNEAAADVQRRGVKLVEERLKLNPDDSRALYMGANGLVALGETQRGLRWAEQALEIDPEEPMVLYNVACIQSLAGQTSQAIESLERAVAGGLHQKGWLENDSNLDPLREHPRFLALMKSM